MDQADHNTLSYAPAAQGTHHGTIALCLAGVAAAMFVLTVTAEIFLGKPSGDSPLKPLVVGWILSVLACCLGAIIFGMLGYRRNRSKRGRALLGIAIAIVVFMSLAVIS